AVFDLLNLSPNTLLACGQCISKERRLRRILFLKHRDHAVRVLDSTLHFPMIVPFVVSLRLFKVAVAATRGDVDVKSRFVMSLILVIRYNVEVVLIMVGLTVMVPF